MRLRTSMVTVAAFLLAGAAAGQGLDEVLAKNLAARGGRDALKSVETVRVAGTMSLGQGMEAPFAWEWKRPNKIRTEFTFQGMTGIQAFDGETGWMVMPFMGKTEPERMAESERKNVAEQADFEGPLVDWKEKGHKVELLGTESVEGTEAYKLKVTRQNGDISMIFLDAEHFLEIREEATRVVQGQELEFVTEIGDYKEVGGLMLAHSMASKAKGMPMGQAITFSKIELNPTIDEGRFTMPPPAAAPKS
jgi:outer membrane lipoprotein-sorting protein